MFAQHLFESATRFVIVLGLRYEGVRHADNVCGNWYVTCSYDVLIRYVGQCAFPNQVKVTSVTANKQSWFSLFATQIP